MLRNTALVAAVLSAAVSLPAIAGGPLWTPPPTGVTPADLGPGFHHKDLTNVTAAREKLEQLAASGKQIARAPVRPRRAAPGAIDSPDVIQVEANSCSQGCIVSAPQQQGSLTVYDVDPYASIDAAYNQVSDDYDVVVLWTTFHTTMLGGAYFSPIANDVKGINANESGQFPSETYNMGPQIYGGTRLRGLVLMQDWYMCDFFSQFGLPCNLTAPFDETFESPYSIFGQESAHEYEAFVRSDRGDPMALLGRDNEHWSYFVDSGGSPMEGNWWKDNGDGTFTIQAQPHTAYSKLDLYLQGLLPPSDVGDIWYVANPNPSVAKGTPPWPTPADAQGNPGPQNVTGSRTDLDIKDITTANGDRVPDWKGSPKIYKQLWVLIHLPGDDPATVQKDYADLAKFRAHWNDYFYRITDFRRRVITTESGRDDYPNWVFKLSPEDWQSTDPANETLSNPSGHLVISANTDKVGIETHMVKIDTSLYKSVHLTYTASAATSGPGYLSWSTALGGGFTTDDTALLPTVHDGVSRTYVVDLTKLAGWTGVVGSLRFVPSDKITQKGAELAVDGITFSRAAVADDQDGDMIADASDNCPTVANPTQADDNGDGVGNACEPDTDKDGIPDWKDPCPTDPKNQCPAAKTAGGCGCSATGGGEAGLWGVVVLAGFLEVSRRRRRRA